MSEPYRENSLLDSVSRPRLEVHYERERRREQELLAAAAAVGGRRALGRLRLAPRSPPVPQAAWRMTGVEIDEAVVHHLVDAGELDEGLSGRADGHPLPDESFDVVLYRLVLHHIVFQGPLQPVFAEARRLLRPGGALVAVEPGRGARWAPGSRWPTARPRPARARDPRRRAAVAAAAPRGGARRRSRAGAARGQLRLAQAAAPAQQRSVARSARLAAPGPARPRSCCWLLGLVALRDDLLAPRPVRLPGTLGFIPGRAGLRVLHQRPPDGVARPVDEQVVDGGGSSASRRQAA